MPGMEQAAYNPQASRWPESSCLPMAQLSRLAASINARAWITLSLCFSHLWQDTGTLQINGAFLLTSKNEACTKHNHMCIVSSYMSVNSCSDPPELEGQYLEVKRQKLRERRVRTAPQKDVSVA